jgi:hypothetical protein
MTTLSRYGVEPSEEESKLIRARNLGAIRMLSLLPIVDILSYLLLIFILEIAAPSLFAENTVRTVVTAGIYFALIIPSNISVGYLYRKRHPELRRIQDDLKQKARHRH